MSEPWNPYASPSAQHHPSDQLDVRQPVVPAAQWARFSNLVIDQLALFAISFVFGIVVAVVGGEQGVAMLDGIPGLLIGIPILLFYYFVFEATTSRTLGKFITGTKVVNQNGQTPTRGQIAARTLCRLIPFEAFSFFGAPPVGWHDSIPKTFVVKVR